MSGKAKDPSEGISLEHKTSRRTLLKSALMVLGAGAIVQVSGGVFAQNTPVLKTPKKEGSFKADTVKVESKSHKGSKATHKGSKTTHKATGHSSFDVTSPMKSTTPPSKAQ